MAINYWLSIILFVFSVVTIMCGLYSFQIKYSIATTVLGIFAMAVAVYSIGYAVEIIGSSFKIMRMFHSVKIIALSLLPGLVLIMTQKVVHKSKAKYYRRFISRFLAKLFSNELNHLWRLFNRYVINQYCVQQTRNCSNNHYYDLLLLFIYANNIF